jgi:hypothetical protein
MVLSFLGLAANAASEPPLTLTMSAPHAMTVGDKLVVTAVLKNVSNQIAAIPWGVPYTTVVHREDGQVPPLKPGYWASGGSRFLVPIEPGKTFTVNMTLLSRYDLAPGKYIVQIKLPLRDPNYPKDTMIDSNEITITVLPKRPGNAK